MMERERERENVNGVDNARRYFIHPSLTISSAAVFIFFFFFIFVGLADLVEN